MVYHHNHARTFSWHNILSSIGHYRILIHHCPSIQLNKEYKSECVLYCDNYLVFVQTKKCNATYKDELVLKKNVEYIVYSTGNIFSIKMMYMFDLIWDFCEFWTVMATLNIVKRVNYVLVALE